MLKMTGPSLSVCECVCVVNVFDTVCPVFTSVLSAVFAGPCVILCVYLSLVQEQAELLVLVAGCVEQEP